MSTEATEHHTFQAEVGQLLDIVTHSLYTDKEIFIRELVSNAADALEKLRHVQLTEKEIFDDKLPLEINITTDESAKTVTIQDFGIGMTREELAENLGTIAHSGSKAFVEALKQAKEAGEAASNLIGQFGVGFYSAFMVAKEVKVYTHSWKPEGEHLLWQSDGKTGYDIETSEGQRRGAKVVVYLGDENKEFSQGSRVQEILKKYSSFVPFPINVNGEKLTTVQAIWLRNKSEITEEEYTEFYKYQANAFDEPRFKLHFNADAPLTINTLLFTPKENMERFGFGRMEPGVALYCKKVLIDPKPEGLLPEWLRFLTGVVDSADLPLNISRESMQDSALVQKLSQVITGRYIKSLDEIARKQPDDYEDFYKTFHIFLKEGVTTDHAHREKLGKLQRYESSLTQKGKLTSLDDYISRASEEQKEIYYLYGPNRAALESGPYLEAFKAQGKEVLFMYEPIDEFVMSHLSEYKEKKLVAADSSEAKLDDVSSTAEGEALEEAEVKQLSQWLRDTLGKEKVKEVSSSKRLVNSPAMALNADAMMTASMRRMMKMMRPEERDDEGAGPVNLEINPRHPLIKNLNNLRTENPDTGKLVAEQILDNALVSAGFMEDPRPMVDRVYRLLEKVSGKG